MYDIKNKIDMVMKNSLVNSNDRCIRLYLVFFKRTFSDLKLLKNLMKRLEIINKKVSNL